MSIFAKTAGVLLIVMVGIGVSAVESAADTQKGFQVPMTCSDGNTYTTVAQAGETWNAQLITDSTSVFHLTNYSLSFEATAPDGTITMAGPFVFTKGGNDRDQKKLLTCTYDFTTTGPDGTQYRHLGVANGWLTPSS